MLYFSDFGVPAPPDDIPASGDFTITVGTPTVSDGSESMAMSAPTGGTQIHGLLKALPGGDFSVIVKLHGTLPGIDYGIGIIFRDTAGKYVTIINVRLGTNNVSSHVANWSTATNRAAVVAGTRDHLFSTIPQWLKATFTASNNDIEGFYSNTGDNWVSLGTSTYLGTADAFGIGLPQNHAAAALSTVQYVYFPHFEVV